LIFLIFVAKKGRANFMLKPTVTRRKTKAEIEQKKKEDEEQKSSVEECKTIKEFLQSKRFKLDDIPKVVNEQEELVKYLKEKGLMNSQGQINV